ncbi:3-phosphoshikimate 1-carboxyvinyltransferase [Sporosarcina sp. 179-K 8C2 HS]|uniref:3-phosphoshikimate 1-carboxyvinyltransferase n=1 Tax=Sporosarcina sp. 179-K 8C2 HS TaxID=3142387 RepID=UPI00399FB7BC
MVETKTVKFDKPIVKGSLKVPGDKSISHRAIMLGSIAEGRTKIKGFLDGEDCLRTIEIFKRLGVSIERNGTDVLINSPGINNWTAPAEELYAGNSGTTARLMLGILSGSTVTSTLTGDASLSKRPMKRVTTPLQSMGASISGEGEGDFLPLTIVGSTLDGIDYQMPVASAQVKSAILFAGLNAKGETVVRETAVSRDHTERMLKQFGAELVQDGNIVSIQGGQVLTGTNVIVPGDISSAAFFMAAAAMIEDSEVEFKDVGLNPTRTGIIEVLRQMGAEVEVLEHNSEKGEHYGVVKVAHARLEGIEISGDIIPTLIDELPIIALLATQATGTTIIKDAAELRVKETDRIAAVTDELTKLGAKVEATEDGMIIEGPTALSGGELKSYGDHRIGMMAAIAALVSAGPIHIEDPSCIAISYPNFFDHLSQLVKVRSEE